MTTAGQQMHGGMMMGGHEMQDAMTMMGPMMILGFVFLVAVLAALIVGIVWLVRNLTGDRDTGRPSPLEQLEMRYARGEIDRDDYLQRRDDLERG